MIDFLNTSLLVIAGGLDSSGQTTKVVYRYDADANKWTKLADLPAPRHHMPLVVANDTLYAIGGFDDLKFTPRAETRLSSWGSEATEGSLDGTEILRCAQDDA